jgi:ribonuclease I
MLSKLFLCNIALLCCVLYAAPLTVQASDVCSGKDYGTPGDFDYYIFALSWPAQFCHGSSEQGCTTPTTFMKSNFCIHGLWPNYNSARDGHYYPQCCDSPYGNSINMTDISSVLSDLETYWPNEQDLDPSSADVSKTIWEHEWQKHGTCSGEQIDAYFSAGINKVESLGTQSIISSNIGGTVSREDIEKAYNGGQACVEGTSCTVCVECSGKYLSGITTCWSPQGIQMKCPTDTIDNCQRCGDDVTISSF